MPKESFNKIENSTSNKNLEEIKDIESLNNSIEESAIKNKDLIL